MITPDVLIGLAVTGTGALAGWIVRVENRFVRQDQLNTDNKELLMSQLKGIEDSFQTFEDHSNARLDTFAASIDKRLERIERSLNGHLAKDL